MNESHEFSIVNFIKPLCNINNVRNSSCVHSWECCCVLNLDLRMTSPLSLVACVASVLCPGTPWTPVPSVHPPLMTSPDPAVACPCWGPPAARRPCTPPGRTRGRSAHTGIGWEASRLPWWRNSHLGRSNIYINKIFHWAHPITPVCSDTQIGLLCSAPLWSL